VTNLQLLGNVSMIVSRFGKDNDAGSQGQLLGGFMTLDQLLQLIAFVRGQYQGLGEESRQVFFFTD
jgi:hypothetical protein